MQMNDRPSQEELEKEISQMEINSSGSSGILSKMVLLAN